MVVYGLERVRALLELNVLFGNVRISVDDVDESLNIKGRVCYVKEISEMPYERIVIGSSHLCRSFLMMV